VVADLVSALAMRAEEEAKRARDQLTLTQTDIATAVGAVTKVDGAVPSDIRFYYLLPADQKAKELQYQGKPGGMPLEK